MNNQEAASAEIALLFDEASGDIAVGELEAAVEKYRRCIDLDPECFDGWHALGMALMKTGHFSEAIEAGLKATQLRPNDQLAWSSLSMFYVRNNQIAEAESAGVKARILSWGGKIVKEDVDTTTTAEVTALKPIPGDPTHS
jgi:Flp pilus assembly protein TadD